MRNGAAGMSGTVRGAGGPWRPSAWLCVAMWLAAAGVYAAYFQGQWLYGERPIYFITGDEPHYLIVATSLLRDGDLDVLNNYREQDYRVFYPYHLGDARDPEDMHVLYGRGGHLFSKHSLGLPLLLLPAIRLAGYGPAKPFMMAVTALLSVQAYLLALELTGRRGPAWFAWVAVSFTSPLLLYADQLYPEVPGALLVVAGVRAVLRPRFSAGPAVVAGWCVGLLPWFHLRYVPLAAILGLAAAVRALAGRRWPPLAGLALPAGLLGGALLALDWHLFGGVPRVDEYGTVALGNLVAGIPGLLFDRAYGLLTYAPVFLLAIYGLALLPRRLGRHEAGLVGALVATYFLFVGGFSYWYGAFSPPARMLVPVVPLLVVTVALALAHWRTWRFRVLAGALLIASWAEAHLLMDVPYLRYNFQDSQSQALLYLSHVWGRDLKGALPSFVVPTAGGGLWALTAALAAGGLWLVCTRPLTTFSVRRPADRPAGRSRAVPRAAGNT